MKKLLCLIVFVSFFLTSCEESFSPKTDFQDKYVLNAVMQAGDGPERTLIASVSRLYDVEGFNPFDNKTDPSVPGAALTLTVNNREYVMVQDTVKRTDTSRYADTVRIVYRSEPVQLRQLDKVSITAVMPDGTVLSSSSVVPKAPSLYYSYTFNNGITTKINRAEWGNSWKVFWTADEDYLYFTRLVINYYIFNNGSLTPKQITVPSTFINNNGKQEPHYPSYSWETEFTFDLDAIDYAMAKLSEGDSLKLNYLIKDAKLEILTYDKNLASYYSSVSGYLDNYSIRLDESTYSNVSGGIGIMGTSYYTSKLFNINQRYIESFGYSNY